MPTLTASVPTSRLREAPLAYHRSVEGFELVLVLVVVVGAVVSIARRIHAPWPVLLVLAGLALTLIPAFSHVAIEPDLVLTIFLPPLLFGAAWETPVQDLKRYRRPIALLSVGLVLFTTAVVAFVGVNVIPGIPLAAAFALGAIVAPPDAISAIAILRPLAAPRRLLAILEGESLVNDATALTAYGVSVAAVTSVFVLSDAIADFAWVLGVGLAVGLAVGIVCGWIWQRLFDPPVEISLSLVIPYLAYLPAEQLGGSGVIAAVTAGLYLGYRQSRILRSDARVLGASVWEFVTYILNGFAFLIIGLELPGLWDAVRGNPTDQLLFQAAAVSLAVIVRAVRVGVPGHVPAAHPAVHRQGGDASARSATWSSWRGLACAAPSRSPRRWHCRRTSRSGTCWCSWPSASSSSRSSGRG